MDVTKAVRVALAQRGMTSSSLAEKLGVTPGTMSKTILTGCLRTDTLSRIAKALDMKASELLALGED